MRHQFFNIGFDKDKPTDVIANIQRMTGLYVEGAGWGLYAAMTKVIDMASDNAPRRSGTLEASGYVTLPESMLEPTVEGGFGGPADPYVIDVNRRTHFFTRAVDGAGGLREVVAQAIVDFVESGVTPPRGQPVTPHNSGARAAAAAKGGP